MADGNGNGVSPKKKGEISAKHALAVAIVSAVLGSTGGPYILDRLLGFNPYRTDPYTGTQGAVVDRRLEALERSIGELDYHIKNHPDSALRSAIIELREQSAEAKAERNLIISNQNRILDRLDRLD